MKPKKSNQVIRAIVLSHLALAGFSWHRLHENVVRKLTTYLKIMKRRKINSLKLVAKVRTGA